MKSLTIYQPWASLIAAGAKRYETRSWATVHRGKLAIHAAKKFPPQAKMTFWEYPFILRLEDAGFDWPGDLPLGAVVATCDLVACIRVTPVFIATLSEDEMAFGNFTFGRYAWKLENVQTISPVYVLGRQGLWNWNKQ